MKKLFLILTLMIFINTVAFTESKQTLNTALPSEKTISENLEKNAAANKNLLIKKSASITSKTKSGIDLKEVFAASPIIYTILLAMSVTALVILLYNYYNFRPKNLISLKNSEQLKQHLYQEKYQEALIYCEKNGNLLSAMITAGIEARSHGPQYTIDSMKDEGRRVTADFWQKLSLLNDIAIIAPMLGLAGTVIGMFYAFYDVNRSIDSIAALFDGLGIAVGTTVMGLIVSILAMMFHTVLKYKMTKSLHLVEAEAVTLANLIKSHKG